MKRTSSICPSGEKQISKQHSIPLRLTWNSHWWSMMNSSNDLMPPTCAGPHHSRRLKVAPMNFPMIDLSRHRFRIILGSVRVSHHLQHHKTSLDNQPAIRAVLIDPPTKVADGPYIYLGIHVGSACCIRVINCHKLYTNRQLFASLKSNYNQTRGRLRRWLSIRQCHHCEFYRFDKLGVNQSTPTRVAFPELDNDDTRSKRF